MITWLLWGIINAAGRTILGAEAYMLRVHNDPRIENAPFYIFWLLAFSLQLVLGAVAVGLDQQSTAVDPRTPWFLAAAMMGTAITIWSTFLGLAWAARKSNLWRLPVAVAISIVIAATANFSVAWLGTATGPEAYSVAAAIQLLWAPNLV